MKQQIYKTGKKNYFITSLVAIMLLPAVLTAQTITTTESRCVNTGTVIISGTAGAGGPYQVSITSAPPQYINPGIHGTNDLPDTIEALYPGAYTLRVVDQNGTAFNSNFTITGNYVLPGNNDYQPVSTAVTDCASPNGAIQGSMTNGRAPYTYTIISGPAQVGAINSTGTFTDLPSGNYQVQAGDSCSNIQTRNVTVINNATSSFTIGNPVINRIGCDSFSLVSLDVSPAFPAGGHYEIRSYHHNGGIPKLYSGTTLPLGFSTYGNNDIADGWVQINVFDACGNVQNIQPSIIANDWSFTPDVSLTCNNGLVLNNVSANGTIPAPYTISVTPYDSLLGLAGAFTAPQTVTSFPYTITGVDLTYGLISTYTTVTDGCGVSKSVSNDLNFLVNAYSNVAFTDCSNTTVTLTLEGSAWTNPVTYYAYLSDYTTVVASNSTGVFTLPDGTYSFLTEDACGRRTSSGLKTFDHNWKTTVDAYTQCEVGKYNQEVTIPQRSIGIVTINQYLGAPPITNASAILHTITYSAGDNGRPSSSPTEAVQWMEFTGTEPDQTYTYTVTDACGKSDTVSITNDHLGHQLITHTTTVKNKCINKADIIGSWYTDIPGYNYVIINVWKENDFSTWRPTYSGVAESNVVLWADADPGTYIVQYVTNLCGAEGYDTITVQPYVQPTVLTAQSFVPCAGGGSPVALTGTGGVSPYTFEIINSTPHHYTAPQQTSSIITLPSSESSITVRIMDACLNSATKTVAVVKASSPVIRTSPAKITACAFPQSVNIFTDSLYEGSQFEWKKISGTGAGAALIGTGPSLPLILTSMADTGTFQVRVTVPGTCYDLTKTYALTIAPCVCTPTSASQNITICSGGSYTIGAHTYTANGTYTDTLVNSIGCDSIVTTNLTINTGCSTTSTIGDKVWQDNDGDGIQDAGEPGIANVTVTLFDAFGNTVATTVTNTSGVYQFGSIAAGNYYIQFSLPASYEFTVSNGTDTNDDTNSDANSTSGYTEPFTITAGVNMNSIDAGMIKMTVLADAHITALATMEDAAAMITWNIKSENNISHYEVERSVDGRIFSRTAYTMTATANNGNSNAYHVTDNINALVNLPAVYYRIKAIGQNGKIAYSNTAVLKIQKNTAVSTWPNPAKNNIYVSVTAAANGTVEARLLDMKGKLVKTTSHKVTKGNNQFIIDGLSNLARGIYILETNINNQVNITRVIKE
ncbi:MAG: SdrD B-like domain-containing protein [Ferruginibacter sp.]